MCDEVSVKENDLFMERIRDLLVESSTFSDISINCKDGQIKGNRLILSIYSNFLTDIFIENPLIVSHPLVVNKENGINLTEVTLADVTTLIQILNSGKYGKVGIGSLNGVLKVAKLLKIDLVIGHIKQGLIDVEAVPKLVEDDNRLNLDMFTPTILASDKGVEALDCSEMKSNVVKEENGDDYLQTDDMVKESKVCPVCKITCKSWAGMKRHLGHAHRRASNLLPDDVIICKCGLTFSKHAKRRVFREHRQHCEAYRNQAFICDICKHAFDSMPALNNHRFVVHSIAKAPKSCICGQTFATKHRVRKHEISCRTYHEAAILCHQCCLPFLTEGHLKQHVRTAHRQNCY